MLLCSIYYACWIKKNAKNAKTPKIILCPTTLVSESLNSENQLYSYEQKLCTLSSIVLLLNLMTWYLYLLHFIRSSLYFFQCWICSHGCFCRFTQFRSVCEKFCVISTHVVRCFFLQLKLLPPNLLCSQGDSSNRHFNLPTPWNRYNTTLVFGLKMKMKIIDINSFTICAKSLLGSMTYKIKTRLV